MPRLVRRRPLWERITSMLNPMDFLLWLSEELETRDWDSKLAGTQLGLGMNFAFLLARANFGSSSEWSDSDIFGDDINPSLLSYVTYPIVWGLVLFSFANAAYALTRTRKYRLFEANIEQAPSTPSARRVQVQSSPMTTSSPLQYLADKITSGSAESRAHPDKKRDVWELAVWDPLPISLRLVCLFSPGHVLAYLLFLPLAPLDPQPSVTVFNTILMQVVLSGQMLFLSSRFTQQAKDNAIIQKEVMNEYNTKFVHPRLNPVVRDVGTQVAAEHSPKGRGFVQVGTPTTLIRKSYATRATSYTDYGNAMSAGRSNVMKPQMFSSNAPVRSETTPTNLIQPRSTSTFKQHMMADKGTAPTTAPMLASAAATAPMPLSVTSANTTPFGGNMGIYNHNKSPLKKTIGLGTFNEPASPRNSREMAALEQQRQPTKHADSYRTGISRLCTMKLTQYIFTALAFLRPRSSSDESPAAFPRIYRYIVDTWVRRPLAPLISLTAVAALTLHLVKMAYFLPPKISDAAIRRTTSTPQAAPAPKKQQQSLIRAWTERRRTASLGEFMKNMFPSQRPERGGTNRGQGYWEQMENEGKTRPRRRMPDSQYSVRDVSADSSHIARWNVPRELSEDQPSGLPQPTQQQQPAVPANSEASSPPNEILPDQSWSWSPHNGSEDQISVTKLGGFYRATTTKVMPSTRAAWELHEGESSLDESGSQASSNPADQPENKPFLDIAAERDANQPRAEASNTALSATQSTQNDKHDSIQPGSTLEDSPRAASFDPSRRKSVGGHVPITIYKQPQKGPEKAIGDASEPTRWESYRNKDSEGAEAGDTKHSESTNINRPAAGRVSHRRASCNLPPPTSTTFQDGDKSGYERIERGVAKLEKQWLEQPWYLQTQPGTEHEQTSNILCEILDKSSEIKGPAYIPTIITTGCNHQTPPSASQLEESIGLGHLLQPTGAQQEELNCSVPAVRSSRNNSGSFHSNPAMSSKQNPTSLAEASLVGEPRADTTFLEQESHKMQLGERLWQGRRSVNAIMMAPEESSLRKSTFIQDQTLQTTNQSKNLSEASQDTQQLVPESETSLADHQMQTHSPPEKHRVGPEHGGEDDTESLLPEDQKLDETKALNTRPGEKSDNKLDAEGQLTELQHFLRYLKTWAQLYWSTVWPILDPRTLRVPHEGPMPLWKACLLIVLATPAVGLGFVVVVQGMKFAMFVAWLLDYSVDDESAIWA
ncbi:hypothetical protein TrVFT333_001251 [Trichoderma virens FT-333]|nr:hypothetical protein TrVFT333_001251 [Trichoderma virens FT-333]